MIDKRRRGCAFACCELELPLHLATSESVRFKQEHSFETHLILFCKAALFSFAP